MQENNWFPSTKISVKDLSLVFTLYNDFYLIYKEYIHLTLLISLTFPVSSSQVNNLLKTENMGGCAFAFGGRNGGQFRPKGAVRLMWPRPPHDTPIPMDGSALFLPQRVCVLPQVHGGWHGSNFAPSRTGTGTRTRSWARTRAEPGSGSAVAGVDLHGAGDGLEGAVPKVVESLLVQVVLLLAQALLKQLSFVSELDHRLGVGVEGGDGGGHAASEGTPGHAGWRETQTHVVDEWVRRKGRRRRRSSESLYSSWCTLPH